MYPPILRRLDAGYSGQRMQPLERPGPLSTRRNSFASSPRKLLPSRLGERFVACRNSAPRFLVEGGCSVGARLCPACARNALCTLNGVVCRHCRAKAPAPVLQRSFDKVLFGEVDLNHIWI